MGELVRKGSDDKGILTVAELQGLQIHIQGIVQGVGFRPFVFGLAERFQLNGWVRNSTAGVDIEVEGQPDDLEGFLTALEEEAPPLARIDSISSTPIPPDGHLTFEIKHSAANQRGYQPISPDVSICPDCLEELFDPEDHRYLYPFINCTNCGPRFTIIKDVPYDRPQTTMAPFPMCPVCESEYQDPYDRRFHAQPVACPDCGPQLRLTPTIQGDASGRSIPAQTADQALQAARELLADGAVLAVKGLGGFHLACDAAQPEAIAQLRSRKDRPAKPLAVMMADLETVRLHCRVNAREAELLSSQERPIVLLDRHPESPLPQSLAPGQGTLGVMLPYTPLHYLLFRSGPDQPDPPCRVLVMTSGNHRGSPIVTGNQEALAELGRIADAVLANDRAIHQPCDDSVTRLISRPDRKSAQIYPIRRSRGYAPYPLVLPEQAPSLLGAGGELKNTFCLTKDRYAFLSQHIGNLTNYETLDAYLAAVEHYQDLFRIELDGIVCDAHPDYLATREAEARAEALGIPLIKAQHHHAHIAACLADAAPGQRDDPTRPVIGFAFDGTGYGEDGKIWGGEVLIADSSGYHRPYHLDYFPLPGGDRAVREPWRAALALLHSLELDWKPDLAPVRRARSRDDRELGKPVLDIISTQLETGTNAPLTSSLGRVFDAVSALIGVRQEISYEAQAAIELEALADPDEDGRYPADITGAPQINLRPTLERILTDLDQQVPAAVISARFHNTLASLVLEISRAVRKKYGLTQVALSGGVWQNITLLEKTLPLLHGDDFIVFTHQSVPANDGGLALGQVMIGQQYLLS